MLIAMAGLSATGRSSLAAGLAQELQAGVLSKDLVRAALFPPPVLNYSAKQDDITMTALFRAAASILTTWPQQAVVLHGRTFLRPYQVQDLLDLARSLQTVPRIIECVCGDAVAAERLAKDQAQGGHPAGNRTLALYRELQANAEPIAIPHLTVDTGTLSLE
jgi:adenylylsulfate kinase